MIRVTLVVSPGPRQVREATLDLADGSTVREAIDAAGLHAPAASGQQAEVGVWGRTASLDQRLRDRDRVEIYRPLIVDPKVARRERFQKQGARSAGLFAKKRAGAKAGY